MLKLSTDFSKNQKQLKVHRFKRLVARRLCAKPEKEQLLSRIRTANDVLEEISANLQQHLRDTRNMSKSLDAQQADLWARQDAVWQREIRRWEEERASWDSREATLLAHIGKLQDKIVELATREPNRHLERSEPTHSTNNLAVGGSVSNDVSNGQEITEYRGQLTQDVPKASSVVEEATQYWPSEDKQYSHPDPLEFENLLDSNDANASAKERIRESLTAAIRAVTDDDVLEATFDNMPSTSGDLGSAPKAPPPDRKADPPLLKLGADDIFWVSQLHNGLVKANVYPGEEDMEDWYFGEQTQSAVLTFQATAGLPETGSVDSATWRLLLGSDFQNVTPNPEDWPSTNGAGMPSTAKQVITPVAESGTRPSSEEQASKSDKHPQIRALREVSEMENRRRNEYSERRPAPSSNGRLQSWPVLREGDGGRHVHHLQVALERKGFIADEEDQQWWWFGPSTQDCVMTFQACSGLPESGVVDPEVWAGLLGSEATPDSLTELRNDFEVDMADDSESVWLLGEQRWARRKK